MRTDNVTIVIYDSVTFMMMFPDYCEICNKNAKQINKEVINIIIYNMIYVYILLSAFEVTLPIICFSKILVLFL